MNPKGSLLFMLLIVMSAALLPGCDRKTEQAATSDARPPASGTEPVRPATPPSTDTGRSNTTPAPGASSAATAPAGSSTAASGHTEPPPGTTGTSETSTSGQAAPPSQPVTDGAANAARRVEQQEALARCRTLAVSERADCEQRVRIGFDRAGAAHDAQETGAPLREKRAEETSGATKSDDRH